MARVVQMTSVLPSLDSLAATLRRYAAELPADDLPALVGELEAAKAVAWARLTTPAPSPTQNTNGELVNAKTMAERLHVPESWLREHARRGRIPCIYVGRYMRFSPTAVTESLTAPGKLTIRSV